MWTPPTHRANGLGSAACLITLLLAPPAGSQSAQREPARAQVHLSPTASCVDTARLLADVAQTLGRQVFTEADSADVQVRVAVSGSPQMPTASIEVRQSKTGADLGSRQVSAANCAELEQTLGLVLSLMLDFHVDEIPELERRARSGTHGSQQEPAGKAQQQQEPEPETDATAPRPAAPANGRPDPLEPTPPGEAADTPDAENDDNATPIPVGDPDASRWTLSLAADGRLGWGSSPGPELGVDAAVGARNVHLYLELGLGFWSGERFTRHGGSISLHRYEAYGMLCPVWGGDAALRWSLCARGQLSVIGVTAAGFADAAQVTDWGSFLGPAGVVDYRLASVFLRTYAVAGVAVRRARLIARDGAGRIEVYEMSPAVGEVGIGVGTEF